MLSGGAAVIEMTSGSRDGAVQWHLGNPFAEARALAEGRALVDLGHYGVIRVSGTDRLSWLHLLVTQSVESLSPGTSAHALVLSAQGHVQHDLKVVDDGTHTWIVVEPGTTAELTSYLRSMVFMYAVAVDDVSADFSILGGFAGATAAQAVAVWSAPRSLALPEAADDPYVPSRPAGWPATLSVVPRGEEPLVGAGMWAWEALRVAAAVPRLGLDTDHRTLPHEVGLIGSAVHLHKGCYRGQEAVARTINLGRPPRRLVQLHVDGASDELPAAGSTVFDPAGLREVGFIGSAVQHYEQGPLALALVKRSVPTDAALTAAVGGVTVNLAQVPVVVIE